MNKINAPILICMVFLSTLLSISESQSQTLYRIREGGLWGYMDRKGKVVIEPQFHTCGNFEEGLAPARINSYYGYIDKTGNFVIHQQFDYAEDFHNGSAFAYLKDSPNIIDKNGSRLLPDVNSYARIDTFIDGRAKIHTRSNKTGVIDITGKLVVDTIFRWINDFDNGVALAGADNENGGVLHFDYSLIDTLGNFIVPFGVYDQIDSYSLGLAVVDLKMISVHGQSAQSMVKET